MNHCQAKTTEGFEAVYRNGSGRTRATSCRMIVFRQESGKSRLPRAPQPNRKCYGGGSGDGSVNSTNTGNIKVLTDAAAMFEHDDGDGNDNADDSMNESRSYESDRVNTGVTTTRIASSSDTAYKNSKRKKGNSGHHRFDEAISPSQVCTNFQPTASQLLPLSSSFNGIGFNFQPAISSVLYAQHEDHLGSHMLPIPFSMPALSSHSPFVPVAMNGHSALPQQSTQEEIVMCKETYVITHKYSVL